MTRRMMIMLVVVGLVFGGVFGFQIFMKTMIKEIHVRDAPPLQPSRG
jgi:membrane fusion protein, multidrug efflux system